MMGQGLAPCPFASEGLVEGNPPQLRLLEEGIGSGALLQALSQPSSRRKPYLPQAPCSLHGVSCLNLVPAPCTPPMLLPKGRTPGTLAGVGQRQALAWCRRGPGSRSPSGSAARGANSPPALQTSLLAQKKVPVPFSFMEMWRPCWCVGITPGMAGGGVADWGALLSAPPGSSLVAGIVPFPPQDFMTDVLSCF